MSRLRLAAHLPRSLDTGICPRNTFCPCTLLRFASLAARPLATMFQRPDDPSAWAGLITLN
jgi:hypothetical protein